MIGKIINGTLIKPSSSEFRKLIITNPTEDMLKYIMNYKDLVIDEEPEYNVETQYLVETYEETDNLIQVHWEVKNIEFEEVIDETI